jgi:hypothetical protein
MAISYSSFLTQVRNYTEVDSTVLTDTLLDQFISNIELDVAGKVDYDDLRKYSTSTLPARRGYATSRISSRAWRRRFPSRFRSC